jgi:hypothetical protein
VTGDGRLKAIGAGIFLRHSLKNKVRLEASMRGGQLENDFNADNLLFNDGTRVSYDYRAPYFGAHLGLAYQLGLNDYSGLDFVGRYFWSYVKDVDVDVSGKDTVKFDATYSNRLRGGLRYKIDTGAKLSLYGGAYLDYEFSSEANAHSSHDNVDFMVNDLKGVNGVFELGGVARFTSLENLNVEFGLEGYIGEFKGVTGGFRIGYEF